MLTIKFSTRFKKDYKAIKNHSDKTKLLQKVVQKIAEGERLSERYKDHALNGEYKDCRECHILPDLLLIYEVKKDELVLILLRVGSHSDLF